MHSSERLYTLHFLEIHILPKPVVELIRCSHLQKQFFRSTLLSLWHFLTFKFMLCRYLLTLSVISTHIPNKKKKWILLLIYWNIIKENMPWLRRFCFIKFLTDFYNHSVVKNELGISLFLQILKVIYKCMSKRMQQQLFLQENLYLHLKSLKKEKQC